MDLKKIVFLLQQSSNIAILPHVSADGDSIGSSTALAQAIEKMGKKAMIYLEEEVAYTLSFVPGMQLATIYDGTSAEHDLVVALDTGDLDRLGKRVDIFKKAKQTVNIDHHPTNTLFADENYVRPEAAAVSEILYELLKLAGVELDKDIATSLYVAIVTDTGGFRYSNTTYTTHQIAGDLINLGAEIAFVSQQVFENSSLGKVRLTGKAIESLEMLEEGKISVIAVTDEMLRECGAKEEDCEGIVNIGRGIRGVEVAVMLRYKDEGLVKVNLRSKEYLDVSAIAAKFTGGGHKRAAGCTVKGTLDQVKEDVVKEIKKVLVR